MARQYGRGGFLFRRWREVWRQTGPRDVGDHLFDGPHLRRALMDDGAAVRARLLSMLWQFVHVVVGRWRREPRDEAAVASHVATRCKYKRLVQEVEADLASQGRQHRAEKGVVGVERLDRNIRI